VSYGLASRTKFTELHRVVNQINWITDNAKNDKSLVTVNTDMESIRLDKNDTQEAVLAAVGKLGSALSAEDGAKVYEEFLRVASKKTVGSKELDAIVASAALQVPATYKLVSYVINNGNIITASAHIVLEKNGKKTEGIEIGDGPIDASFIAIDKIIGHHYELDDFQIQAVTEGKEAMGSAVVKLRKSDRWWSQYADTKFEDFPGNDRQLPASISEQSFCEISIPQETPAIPSRPLPEAPASHSALILQVNDLQLYIGEGFSESVLSSVIRVIRSA
jgi:hypothetical protein